MTLWYFNEEELNKIGIKSKDDLMPMKAWFVDDDFYTVEKLNKISDSYKANERIKDSFLEYAVAPYLIVANNYLATGEFIIYFLILIAAFFAIVFIIIFKPQIRGIVCGIGILAFLWSFFYIISATEIFGASLILLPLTALTLLITIRYNSIQAIVTFSLIAGLLVFYSYLVSYRLLFRTVYSAVLPVLALVIFAINSDNLRVIKKEKDKARGIVVTVVAVLVAAVSLAAGVAMMGRDAYPNDNSNEKIVNYINTHTDDVFLINHMMTKQPYYNPLILPKEHKNIANYGLWLKKTEYYKNTLKRNGIKHLFKDAIDSKNKYIVIFEPNIPTESAENMYCASLGKYYTNHYAEKGKEIKLKRAKRVGGYSLYSVVSQKAPKEPQIKFGQ